MLSFKTCMALTFAAALMTVSSAQAEPDFSNRPIRIVSPFAAGSVSSITMQLLGDRLGERLKTQIVVENMPTAGGIQAAVNVMNAAADGHTLALLSNATAVTAATFKDLPFHPVDSFVAISGVSDFAYLFLTSGESEFKTLESFLAASGKKDLNVGTARSGSTPHLMALLLKDRTKADFAVVPYSGAADLVVAALRQDIDLFINSYGAVVEQINSGQLRPLAVTTEERFDLLPDVPTMLEAGVSDYVVSSWNGLFAPAGTPDEIVEALGAEIRAILNEPEFVEKLANLGLEVWPSEPAELTGRMTVATEQWTKVARDAGITANN